METVCNGSDKTRKAQEEQILAQAIEASWYQFQKQLLCWLRVALCKFKRRYSYHDHDSRRMVVHVHGLHTPWQM